MNIHPPTPPVEFCPVDVLSEAYVLSFGVPEKDQTSTKCSWRQNTSLLSRRSPSKQKLQNTSHTHKMHPCNTTVVVTCEPSPNLLKSALLPNPSLSSLLFRRADWFHTMRSGHCCEIRCPIKGFFVCLHTPEVQEAAASKGTEVSKSWG